MRADRNPHIPSSFTHGLRAGLGSKRHSRRLVMQISPTSTCARSRRAAEVIKVGPYKGRPLLHRGVHRFSLLQEGPFMRRAIPGFYLSC